MIDVAQPLRKKSLIPETVRLGKQQKKAALVTVIVPMIFTALSLITLFFVNWLSRVDIALLVSFFLLSSLGVSVGYHRLFAHKGFEAKPWVKKLLAITGSMTAQGPVIFWVATHRMHHAYSDTEQDPHSPHNMGEKCLDRLRGFFHAHIGWMFHNKTANSMYYAKDLLKDDDIVKINQQYNRWVLLGIFLPGLIGGVLTQSLSGFLTGALWGGVVRIFLNHQATWSVNSISHVFGDRPYRSKDLSTNNLFVALIAMGEGWHNNHHAFPRSAAHGFHWWQIDFSYYLIWIFERLGWVWNVYVPTQESRDKRLNQVFVNQ